MRQASNASQVYLKQIQVQHGPQTHWVQVVRATKIHRTNSTYICAYRYEIEFHAHLSHLGFDGVYPIYWINKSKHAIRYTYSKYACTKLSRTKWDTIWTKTPIKPRKHTQVWWEKEMSKLYQ